MPCFLEAYDPLKATDRRWDYLANSETGSLRCPKQPCLVVDHRVGGIDVIDEKGVLEILHHGKVRLVEQEPSGQRHALGVENPAQLVQVEGGPSLGDVR